MVDNEQPSPRLWEPAPYDPDAVRLTHSPGMAEWMVGQRVSLAYTSYQTGRLIVAGVAPDGRLFFNEQNYTRAMGLHYADGQLYVASLFQIWRLGNMLAPGEFANRAFDCVLVPRVAHVTGYVDAHELGVDRSGRVIFANSRFSCLAATDPDYSFRPIWKPRFISALAAEDRCHLNGLAMSDGVPAFVTAVSSTDTPSGWRQRPQQGGVLIDVASREIVTDSLSMPHSPRLYRGGVLVLDSGRGMLVGIDPASGARTEILFLPGFLRGMALHGDFALIAASKPRGSSVGLPFEERLARERRAPWCGIFVVDLVKAAVVEFIRYEAEVVELFDLAILPNIRNPMTVGPATEELLTAIRFDPTISL